MNQDYQILLQHKLSRNQIVFIKKNGLKTYDRNITDLINQTWEKAISNNQYLYNGSCFSLLNSVFQDDILTLDVIETDYKSLFGTNITNYSLIPDKDKMANALAACMVVQTADHKIIVGKRNSQIAEFVSLWHVIGGTLEKINHDIEHPFDLMQKELHEELNIEKQHIKEIYCMGMAIPFCNNKPEFLFYAEIDLNSSQVYELYQTAKDKYEHDDLEFIQLTDFYDFIKDKKFSPIGKAAIDFKLKELI